MNTYQIKSKFGGTCRECGNYIKAGAIVNWTPNDGIRHVKACNASEAIETRQETREVASQNVGRVNVMELA